MIYRLRIKLLTPSTEFQVAKRFSIWEHLLRCGGFVFGVLWPCTTRMNAVRMSLSSTEVKVILSFYIIVDLLMSHTSYLL